LFDQLGDQLALLLGGEVAAMKIQRERKSIRVATIPMPCQKLERCFVGKPRLAVPRLVEMDPPLLVDMEQSKER
jgi:hypothetical protein